MPIPRRIILASQNETIRRGHAQDVDLASLGIIHNVVIIIKDRYGYASLTHIDPETILAFINIEIQWLQNQGVRKNDITLDIIEHKNSSGAFSRHIIQYLIDNQLNDIPSSKEDQRIRRVNKGTVLLRDEKIYQPDLSAFSELTYKILSESALISDSNPLKNDILEISALNPLQQQQDIYITQLNCSIGDTRLPKIVHDENGWKPKKPVKLSTRLKNSFSQETAVQRLELLEEMSYNIIEIGSDFLAKLKKCQQYVLPRLKQNIEQQKVFASEKGYSVDECPWIQVSSFLYPVEAEAVLICLQEETPLAIVSPTY